jgi:hypothetical protein
MPAAKKNNTVVDSGFKCILHKNLIQLFQQFYFISVITVKKIA